MLFKTFLGVGGIKNLGEYSPTNARVLGDGVFFGTKSGYSWMSLQKNDHQFQIIAKQSEEYLLYYRTCVTYGALFWHKLSGPQVGNDEISQFI